MPLFTDSGLIGISDLEAYESTLSKIASTHGINLDSKTAISIADIGDSLLARLMRAGSAGSPWFNPVGFNPVATGRYNIVSIPPQSRWYLNLTNVVVTSPLQRWLCYTVLSQVFAEAYNVQMNERFKNKWAEYSGRAQGAESLLYQLGIGVVWAPLPQPPDRTDYRRRRQPACGYYYGASGLGGCKWQRKHTQPIDSGDAGGGFLVYGSHGRRPRPATRCRRGLECVRRR